MANIEHIILSDAQQKRPNYADRMQVVELSISDLPTKLKFYTIKITGLFDYLPINYVVLNNNYYSSLEKGDFGKFLEYVGFLAKDVLSAWELTKLFFLLEFPSKDRLIVEKLADTSLTDTAPEDLKEKLNNTLETPLLRKTTQGAELFFYCENVRTGCLEVFSIRVSPSYLVDGESREILSLRHI